MAFIPVPDTVEVVLRFIWAGQVVSITLSFYRAGGSTTAQMSNLLTELKSWHNVSMKTQMSSFISLTGLSATDISSATSPTVELPVSPVVPGSIGQATVANNVTLVTSFITALRGRSFRGRVYTPGLVNASMISSVDAGLTQAALWSGIYAAMPSYANNAGYTHVVVSRYANNAARVTGLHTPVTAYRTEQYLDSQRRRLYGRGI